MAIITAGTGDGHAWSDGLGFNPPWSPDGFGDHWQNPSASPSRVGEVSSSNAGARYRAFIPFDISSLSSPVVSAILWIYYYSSWGRNLPGVAPDSSKVGHCIVDHIDNFLPGDKTDFEMASKTADIGTIIGDDIAPVGWYSLDVTAYVNTDIREGGTPDNTCFRLRQSLELPNFFQDNRWEIAAAEQAESPYLEVTSRGQVIRIQTS